MKDISRRQLLTSTAVGTAAFVLGALPAATSAIAKTAGGASHDAFNCAHNHHALGHKLSTLIADRNVDDAVKNHAIKTAACPSCGTGIAPTGLGLAARTWI